MNCASVFVLMALFALALAFASVSAEEANREPTSFDATSDQRTSVRRLMAEAKALKIADLLKKRSFVRIPTKCRYRGVTYNKGDTWTDEDNVCTCYGRGNYGCNPTGKRGLEDFWDF